MTPEDLSWSESRKLILNELDRMEKAIEDVGSKVDRLRDSGRDNLEAMRKEYDSRFSSVNVQLAMMQVKIGLGAAVLSIAVSVLVSWLTKGH